MRLKPLLMGCAFLLIILSSPDYKCLIAEENDRDPVGAKGPSPLQRKMTEKKIHYKEFIESQNSSKNKSDVIIITAEEIRNMNVRTITELLNQIPNVTAGESSIKLRGSYKVRVLLNGRPINDPLSKHSSIKWNLVSLKDVERIEIHKGGGSIAYGDDTSGGAIIITSKKIIGSKVSAETSFGNLCTQNYFLNFQQEIGDWGFGISAGLDKTDGFRDNNDKEKRRAGARVSFKPWINHMYDLSVDYSWEDAGRAGLPQFPTPRARVESEAVSSILLCKLGRIKIGTHYSYFEKKNSNPDSSTNPLNSLNGWSFGEDLSSGFSISKNWSVNTGFNIEVDEIEGNKFELHREEKLGVFISNNFRFSTIPLNMTIGVRSNFYSEFATQVNPEIKAGFDLGKVDLQAAVSRTNNIPPLLKRYDETSTTRANPSLDVEKSMNYSATISFKHKKAFHFSLSPFLNTIKDRITYVREDDGTGMYENFGEVTRKGIEASLCWVIIKGISVASSYTYLIAKDEETGYYITCSPKHTARLDLKYKPLDELSFMFNNKYASDQFSRSDNSESVSCYYVADFKAEYYLNRLRFFLKVENMFDNDYHYGDGYPAPPREYLVGLSCDF